MGLEKSISVQSIMNYLEDLEGYAESSADDGGRSTLEVSEENLKVP